MVISNIIHIVIICVVVSHFGHQRAVNTHHNPQSTASKNIKTTPDSHITANSLFNSGSYDVKI